MINIDEFRSKLYEYGGVGRSNLFVVNMYQRNGSNAFALPGDVDLRLFCTTATIPSINFNTVAHQHNTPAMSMNMPVEVTNSGFNCTFMIDAEHRILSFFHQWASRVMNMDVSKGLIATKNGVFPYELNFMEEYTVTMEIHHYSAADPTRYYSTILYDVYPTQIGEVSLSWAENDSVMTLPVNFSYSGIVFDGSKTGAQQNYLDRSQGYIQQILAATGNETQVVFQRGRPPSSVQDAINRVTPPQL